MCENRVHFVPLHIITAQILPVYTLITQIPDTYIFTLCGIIWCSENAYSDEDHTVVHRYTSDCFVHMWAYEHLCGNFVCMWALCVQWWALCVVAGTLCSGDHFVCQQALYVLAGTLCSGRHRHFVWVGTFFGQVFFCVWTLCVGRHFVWVGTLCGQVLFVGGRFVRTGTLCVQTLCAGGIFVWLCRRAVSVGGHSVRAGTLCRWYSVWAGILYRQNKCAGRHFMWLCGWALCVARYYGQVDTLCVWALCASGLSVRAGILCGRTLCVGRHSVQAGTLCRRELCADRHSVWADPLCRRAFFAGGHSVQADTLCGQALCVGGHSVRVGTLCGGTLYSNNLGLMTFPPHPHRCCAYTKVCNGLTWVHLYVNYGTGESNDQTDRKYPKKGLCGILGQRSKPRRTGHGLLAANISRSICICQRIEGEGGAPPSLPPYPHPHTSPYLYMLLKRCVLFWLFSHTLVVLLNTVVYIPLPTLPPPIGGILLLQILWQSFSMYALKLFFITPFTCTEPNLSSGQRAWTHRTKFATLLCSPYLGT